MRERSVDLTLQWSRVNAEFEPTEFSKSWLDVADGTVVADERVPGNPRKCNGTPTSIPLDLTTVRATDGSRYGVQRTVFEARSHFQTCPEPGKFSKKGG